MSNDNLAKLQEEIQKKVSEAMLQILHQNTFKKVISEVAEAAVKTYAQEIIKSDGDLKRTLQTQIETILNEHLAQGKMPSNMKVEASVSLYVSLK